MKRSLAILGAVVLVAGAACGGDDDIAGLDGVPSECVDLMGQYLEVLEPAVKDTDWENATMEDMISLGDSIPEPSEDMEAAMTAAGCDDLQFDGGDDEAFAAVLAIARDKAPGTVGYLTWIESMMSGFEEMTADLGELDSLGELTGDLGDLGDLTGDLDLGELESLAEEFGDMTGGDMGDLGDLTTDLGDLGDLGALGELGDSDLPQDCDGAKGYIEALMESTDGTLMDLPINEMMNISGLLMTMTGSCSANELNEFMSRPDVTEFLSAAG